MIVRKAKLEDLARLGEISAMAFNYPFTIEPHADEQAYVDNILSNPSGRGQRYWHNHWLAETDEGVIFSRMICHAYEVWFDGHKVKMSGIGGVATFPEFRKQGAVRAIFEACIPAMYDEDYAFSYLYPFSAEFYRKFGYEYCCQRMQLTIEVSQLPAYDYSARGGQFILKKDNDCIEGFKAVHEVYAKRYNMCVIREEIDWADLKKNRPFKDNVYAYLYKNGDGVPTGYIIFKKEPDKNNEMLMEVRELEYTDPDSIRAIFDFVRAHGGNYKSIRFFAPNDVRTEQLCVDPAQASRSRSECTLHRYGMARVVNVQKVFSLARYRGTGAVIVAITDPQVKQNNGSWLVEYENGQAKSVSLTDKAPDVTMPITELAPAILGHLSAEDFPYRDTITVHNPQATLADVFYHKPNYINNYF